MFEVSLVKSSSDECHWTLQRGCTVPLFDLTEDVNIGSGNELLPSGNKSLPEPMLSQIYVAAWCHYDTIIVVFNEFIF